MALGIITGAVIGTVGNIISGNKASNAAKQQANFRTKLPRDSLSMTLKHGK